MDFLVAHSTRPSGELDLVGQRNLSAPANEVGMLLADAHEYRGEFCTLTSGNGGAPL
jgi:hypothetical protein